MGPTLWIVNHNRNFAQEEALGIITAPFGQRDPYKKVGDMRTGDRTFHVLRGQSSDWDLVAIGRLTGSPTQVAHRPYAEARRLKDNAGWRLAPVAYSRIPPISVRRFAPSPAERYFTTSPMGYLHITQGVYVRPVGLIHAVQFAEVLLHELSGELTGEARGVLAPFSARADEDNAPILVLDVPAADGYGSRLGSPEPLPPARHPGRRRRTSQRRRRRPAHDWVRDEAERVRVGQLGEVLVLARERERFASNPAALERVQREPNENAGYDVLSVEEDELGTLHELHIEVKATRDASLSGFYISPNELAHPSSCPAHHRLALVWDVESPSPRWSMVSFDQVFERFRQQATQFFLTLR